MCDLLLTEVLLDQLNQRSHGLLGVFTCSPDGEGLPLHHAERQDAKDALRVNLLVGAGPCEDDDLGPSVGQVYAIYLVAECWGRGIGRDLLQRAETDLGSAGYQGASLWVLTTNDRARRFYEAAGWRPDGTHKIEPFGGAELDEIRYRKQLL